MAATLMYGKPLAERIRAEVAEEVRRLGGVGLATVLVGDDPASQVYIRHKHDAAVAAGFDTRDIRLPADAPEVRLPSARASAAAVSRRVSSRLSRSAGSFESS